MIEVIDCDTWESLYVLISTAWGSIPLLIHEAIKYNINNNIYTCKRTHDVYLITITACTSCYLYDLKGRNL